MSQYPSTGDQLNKLWYTHILEHYTVVKRKQVILYVWNGMLCKIKSSENRGRMVFISHHHLYKQKGACLSSSLLHHVTGQAQGISGGTDERW